MEGLSLIIGTVIAVCALLAVQLGVVYFLLNAKIDPVKESLDKHIANTNQKLDQILKK